MNNNFTNFSFTTPFSPGTMTGIISGAETVVTRMKKPNLTPREFDEICKEYPSFCNTSPSSGFCFFISYTIINTRNLNLLEHIIKIAGTHILSIASQSQTLLHYVFDKDSEVDRNYWQDQDAETREYCTAKKLLKLGARVNIISVQEHPKFGIMPLFGAVTPLDHALSEGKIKSATLFLRNGGIPLTYMGENLEKAKKEIMTKTEKLFKLHFNNFETQDGCKVPKEIIDNILRIGLKVELQD